MSPNHQLLAFLVDTTGSEMFTLYVKDLATDELLDYSISDISRVEWANDNKTLFYTTGDSAERAEKLYRHILGTDPENDELVYHEKGEAFYLLLSKSRSKKYLLLYAGNFWTSSEVHYIDADHPMGGMKVITPRQPQLCYNAYHHDDSFYISSSGKLMKVSVENPEKENWQEFIPQRDSVWIWHMQFFSNHLVMTEREKGQGNLKLRIHNLTTDEVHYVEFPEPAYFLRMMQNPEFNTNILRFSYSSLVTPRSIFDYNMDTRTRELKKQDEVLGYNPTNYRSESIYAKAPDGKEVPISMVYRKDMIRDGNNPMLLYGFGSEGMCVEPYFDSNRLSLLDRGFIYAIAHVRGGGIKGKEWHEDGKLLKKKNTFTDFIACAEHLINEKYTSSNRLVIRGASAGGLLMGAVVNRRPDLFQAVVAGVPWVDIITSNFEPTYYHGELGDPNDEQYYRYIKSYSPYDNVKAMDYPSMLVTAGLDDSAVSFWSPAKWTARLRALKTDNNLLLLKTNMAAGHRGASGRYDSLRDIAFEYAFIFDLLGI